MKKGSKQLTKALNAANDLLELDQDDFDSVSMAGSKVSAKTSKTTSGAIAKHCPLCENKKISGPNWNKHDKGHIDKGDGKVKPDLCTGTECWLCKGK